MNAGNDKITTPRVLIGIALIIGGLGWWRAIDKEDAGAHDHGTITSPGVAVDAGPCGSLPDVFTSWRVEYGALDIVQAFLLEAQVTTCSDTTQEPMRTLRMSNGMEFYELSPRNSGATIPENPTPIVVLVEEPTETAERMDVRLHWAWFRVTDLSLGDGTATLSSGAFPRFSFLFQKPQR